MKTIYAITVAGGLGLLSGLPCHAGLVGRWAFEEGAGTTLSEEITSIVSDEAGIDLVWSSDTPGAASIASLSFPGTATGHVRTNLDAGTLAISGTGAKTICGWIKAPDTAGITGMFFGWSPTNGSSTPGGADLRLGLDGAGFLRFEASGGFALYNGTALDDGAWHMVAVVIEADDNVNSVQFYVDGNLVDRSSSGNKLINTAATSADPLRDDIYLGTGNPGSTLHWTGLLDDVRVYDTALTEAALDAIRDSMGAVTPPPSLLWKNASGNGLWNTSALNWFNGTANVAFSSGSSVRFEDASGSLETIGVAGLVEPSGVTLANILTDYQFSGAGTLGGTGQIATGGGGTVTFANTGGLACGGLTISGGSRVLLATAGNHAATSISANSTLELRDGASLTGPVINGGTLLQAATAGTHTLSSVISGGGAVVKDGSASTWALSAVNTLTGTVTLNAGTLQLEQGAKLYQTGAFFGVQNQVYLTVNSGGVFATWNWNYGNAGALSQLRNNYGQILLNGGTIRFTESIAALRAFTVGAAGGSIEATAGTTFTKLAGTTDLENIIRFSADSTLTFAGDGDFLISDDLGAYGSTGFSLQKAGAGTLTLSGANTYTGTTTVAAGILAVGGTSLPDGSGLILAGGIVRPAGVETVDQLFFGAAQQAAGTWGATGSGADHIDNARFSGSDGVVLVLNGPSTGGFAAWAATNGAGVQDLDDDHDSDGVPNGIEYFLGGPAGNTTGPTQLPSVTVAAGSRSVTWIMGAGYTGAYGAGFTVETSATLTGPWTTETVGVRVILSGSSVTYAFPSGPAKGFARLKVTGL